MSRSCLFHLIFEPDSRVPIGLPRYHIRYSSMSTCASFAHFIQNATPLDHLRLGGKAAFERNEVCFAMSRQKLGRFENFMTSVPPPVPRLALLSSYFPFAGRQLAVSSSHSWIQVKKLTLKRDRNGIHIPEIMMLCKQRIPKCLSIRNSCHGPGWSQRNPRNQNKRY